MGRTGSTFPCPACERRFGWKPRIAGRQAKCGCGAVITVPESDPALGRGTSEPLAVEPVDAIFDLADLPTEVTRARPGGTAKPGVAAKPGVSAKPGVAAALEYTKRKSAAEREADAQMSLWGHPSERRAPLVVLVVSALVTVGLTLLEYPNPILVTIYAVAMVFAVGTMVGAAFVAASVAGINFGVLGLAVLRLAAVCFAVDAVSAAMGLLEFSGSGFLELVIRLAVFYGLMMWFFALSFGEVVIVAMIVFVVRFLLGLAMVMWVLSAF